MNESLSQNRLKISKCCSFNENRYSLSVVIIILCYFLSFFFKLKQRFRVLQRKNTMTICQRKSSRKGYNARNINTNLSMKT